MIKKNKGYENYYYYDTGHSVLILCLLKSWFTNNNSLKKLAKRKDKFNFTHKKESLYFF